MAIIITMGFSKERQASAFDGVRVFWTTASGTQDLVSTPAPRRSFDGVVRIRAPRTVSLPQEAQAVGSSYEAIRSMLGGIQGVVRVPRFVRP